MRFGSVVQMKTLIMSNTRRLKSNASSKRSETCENLKTNRAIQLDKAGNICLRVLAKPGSKQNGITSISNEVIAIQIAAPPIEGEANSELVKYLAKLLGLRKSDIKLDKGSRSRQKVVLIDKEVTTIESILSALQQEGNISTPVS